MKFDSSAFKREGGEGGSKLFIQIPKNGSVSGVLRGDFCYFDKKFKSNEAPKRRFSVNMIIHENSAYVAKILEGGAMIYTQLQALDEAGYDLDSTAIMIQKTVQGEKTSYTVTPLAPNKQPNAKQLETIKAVPLRELRPPKSAVSEAQLIEQEFSETEDDLPF